MIEITHRQQIVEPNVGSTSQLDEPQLTRRQARRVSSFKVIVVLPAYNEQENLPGLLDNLAEALVDAGAEAARTAVGIAGMLAVAAFIESFVRQSHLTTNERFVYAGLTGLFWTVYFAQGFLWRTGRGDQSLAEATVKTT